MQAPAVQHLRLDLLTLKAMLGSQTEDVDRCLLRDVPHHGSELRDPARESRMIAICWHGPERRTSKDTVHRHGPRGGRLFELIRHELADHTVLVGCQERRSLLVSQGASATAQWGLCWQVLAVAPLEPVLVSSHARKLAHGQRTFRTCGCATVVDGPSLRTASTRGSVVKGFAR